MKELLVKIANDNKITKSNGKLKQTDGRAIKKALNEKMLEIMQALESELVSVGLVKNGVGVSVDNEKVGFISFEICLVVKDLEYDLSDEMEQYERELADKEKAEKEKERLKQMKIEQDKEKRRIKAELKALEEKIKLE